VDMWDMWPMWRTWQNYFPHVILEDKTVADSEALAPLFCVGQGLVLDLERRCFVFKGCPNVPIGDERLNSEIEAFLWTARRRANDLGFIVKASVADIKKKLIELLELRLKDTSYRLPKSV